MTCGWLGTVSTLEVHDVVRGGASWLSQLSERSTTDDVVVGVLQAEITTTASKKGSSRESIGCRQELARLFNVRMSVAWSQRVASICLNPSLAFVSLIGKRTQQMRKSA